MRYSYYIEKSLLRSERIGTCDLVWCGNLKFWKQMALGFEWNATRYWYHLPFALSDRKEDFTTFDFRIRINLLVTTLVIATRIIIDRKPSDLLQSQQGLEKETQP